MICSNKSVWDISTTLRLKITQKQNCEHSTRESERVWSLFWRLLSTGRINVVDLNKTPDRQLDPREHFTSEGSGQVSFLVLFLTHTQRATTAHLYILCWAADPAGASSTRSALLFGSQCGLFIKVCGRSESRHLSEERFFLQTVEAEGWDQDGFTFFWMNCSFKDLTTPVGLLGNRKSCDCSECIEQAADFLCQTIRTWTCVCVCVCVCVWCHCRRSSSLPDFDDAVSGRGDDEALCGLKGGDVSDDVMVTHREGFWAAARRILHHAALLFTVDLLQRHQSVFNRTERHDGKKHTDRNINTTSLWEIHVR